MSNTMLPIEKAIYQNRNVKKGTYYDKCCKKDVVSLLNQPLRQAGYYLSYEGVYRRSNTAVATDTPWHHVKHLVGKKCLLDHHIKFNLCGYVPPKCLECWKVVVGPRTLKELFQLLEVQRSMGRPSKCGIELRYYTPRLYGGYFYNNSLDEGRECYEAVRKAVDEHISPEVGVILKRACTEYEMIKGPSVAWTMTRREHELDDLLDEVIDTYSPNDVSRGGFKRDQARPDACEGEGEARHRAGSGGFHPCGVARVPDDQARGAAGSGDCAWIRGNQSSIPGRGDGL